MAVRIYIGFFRPYMVSGGIPGLTHIWPWPKWPGPRWAQMARAQMGQNGLGLDGPSWPGPRWAKMARAQMGQDGPGPDGPKWSGPRWTKMARAQMGQDGLGPHGPKWGPGPHGGSGFVEEWPSHKGSGGTHKGKWIPRPWQTLWVCPNPPKPTLEKYFPQDSPFSQVHPGPGPGPRGGPV